MAVELARRGAQLGLMARGVAAETISETAVGDSNLVPSSALESVVKEIEKQSGSPSEITAERTLLLPADVRDAKAVRAAADRLRERCGKIDILIANAGVGATTGATELDPEDVARVINVNVLGAVNSVAAVLPEMAARGSGQLVAISSLAAYRGLPKSAAYCASKASLSCFFESLRIDLVGSGVKVTIIHPGFIKTPLTAGRKADMPYLMELDDAVNKILGAIEKQKKSYAFPWQLATIVRAGMIMPNFMYDWISRRNSFRE